MGPTPLEATEPVEDCNESSSCVPPCGDINTALKVIGDKWTGFIVRELMAGPKRFSEFEQGLGIGPRTLSQRLDTLEVQRIITKKHFAEAPPRVEYSLTTKGEDLLPILQSMAEWTRKYAR
ncbi:MAG TPA: helix-turn-helix domain-containing protein [Candidatus Saccharimonadales bacterium]|jgi:DNA-binding HxlR family transcriptional regulator|nr:helix-turn-helix domain-containing protein [Candidatus Saccharimonadales bacterium]